jgi:hypothetical protein
MSNSKKIKGTKVRRFSTVPGSNLATRKGGFYRIVGEREDGIGLVVKIPRNLQGDYKGTCAVCVQPTDTALHFVGDPDWQVRVLMALGLTEEESQGTWENHQENLPTDADPSVMTVRICRSCVSICTEDFPEPGVLTADGASIPVIRQASDDE